MVPKLLSIVTSVQAGATQALYSENAVGEKKIYTIFPLINTQVMYLFYVI